MAFEYYRSVIGFSCAGNFAAVVQHWGVDSPTGGGPYARAKAFVTAFETPVAGTAYANALVSILSDDSFISSIRCAKVSAGGGNQSAKVFPGSQWPGAFGSDLDAAQVSGCVIWLSAANAGLNGRSFYPGVAETGLDLGRFAAGYKSAMDDVVDVVIAGLQATVGTFLPMIRHTNGTLFAQIVHGRLSLTPGTIRKRLKPV